MNMLLHELLGTDHLTCGVGYGFLFRSEIFFLWTTRELEYLFLLLCKVRIFFPEFNIRLYDEKTLNQIIFFFHQNQNIFFSNIGNQNIFLEKKHNPSPPPFKLNGRSLINSISFAVMLEQTSLSIRAAIFGESPSVNPNCMFD